MTLAGRVLHISVLTLLLGILFPADALAYLDPGTGSLVVQSAVAALAAAGYATRVYWSRIRLWFTRSSPASGSRRAAVADMPAETVEPRR